MFRKPDTPTRFSVADIANATRGTSRAVTFRGSEDLDTNRLSSSSFAYDPYESGLKSTQQLRVDWTKFENHTFFNSAQAKVNVAFDRIVNGYPFDGTKKELERFFDGLTGFEKWTLDQMPRNIGYLNFSSSFISVTDHQGSALPELAKNKTGDSVLDPHDEPYTVEFFLRLPAESAGSQVILQKKHATNNVGLCFYVKSGSSASTAEVAWNMFSASFSLVASASISRSAFVHLAGVYDRDDTAKLRLYVNGELATTTDNSQIFEMLSTDSAPLLIGSGSSFTTTGTTITPDKLLSGSLDELRIFQLARNGEQIKKHSSRNIFAQDKLLLYYKFNEPTGSLSGDETSRTNSIVLDSSGNGLHAFITGFAATLRSTGSIASPLNNERMNLNPVIFPGFADVQSLNATLLLSASRYDQDNPNLITRLVPKHYLIDGQDHQGLVTEEGNVGVSYDGSSIPGSGVLGSTQLLLALLYTWAKYFDELKLFVDAFTKIHYVDYDEKETCPDVFLPFALREFGIKMPNLFSDAAFVQYKDGEDFESTSSFNETSLYSVQNQIMRRVLTNMGEIVRSKGTLHSIETFFRSIGIDPKNSIKLKERGGPTKRSLENIREDRLEPLSFLDFSGGGLITSGYLSSSRTEVGVPTAVGTFVQKPVYGIHGVSNNTSDGLWTSGSFTYEAFYRWPTNVSHTTTQSMMRLHTSGTGTAVESLMANLLAISGSNPRVVLYARPGNATTLAGAPMLTLSASANVFDGDPWYVSWGRVRNDLAVIPQISGSYFLRVSKHNFNDCLYERVVSSSFQEVSSPSLNQWQSLTSSYNAFGSFIRVGSASIATTGDFLSTAITPSESRATRFDGQINQIRFWSKWLNDSEWNAHARDPRSLGVTNPHVNFNFGKSLSGSFERLRLDASAQQVFTASAPTSIFDYSQNNKHFLASGFPTASFKTVMIGYSAMSSNIDEAVTSDKVRVRSYDQATKVAITPWAQTTPVYEIPKNEEPQDDPRLSIEFSLVDSLNRDIITMFSTLDELDDALGAPENDFSSNYHNLEHLKQIYFERLTGKLNFRAFFDFFRWFDSSVAYFVEYLIPRKTVYFGTNFVIESHMLERHKKQYFHYDMYLREADKPLIQDRILLQQAAGIIKRY